MSHFPYRLLSDDSWRTQEIPATRAIKMEVKQTLEVPTRITKDLTFPDLLHVEQAIIGGILIEPAAFDRVADKVTVDDFLHFPHKDIFAIIHNLAGNNYPFDTITVAERLQSLKRTSKWKDGLAYLTKLSQEIPGSANIEFYAKVLHDNSVRRRLVVVASSIIDDVNTRQTEEIFSILDSAEQKILSITDDMLRKKEGFRHIGELGRNLYNLLEERQQEGTAKTGLSTGFHQFDEKTSGLQKGELVIIAGRPGMGKTSLAMNIMENVALKGGHACAFFSLEMASSQIAMRMFASFARVDQMHLKKGKLEVEDWAKLTKALPALENASIYIDDSSILTPVEVRSRVRTLKREQRNLSLVVVDYLQLMQGGSSVAENRAIEISTISRSLKAMAKEVDVCVVALSQLNRQIETRHTNKPQMSDLRESGAIEQDADLVAVIYAADKDTVEDDDSTGDKGSLKSRNRIFNIGVVKHRNGPTFVMKTIFRGNLTRFENYIPEEVIDSSPPIRLISGFEDINR